MSALSPRSASPEPALVFWVVFWGGNRASPKQLCFVFALKSRHATTVDSLLGYSYSGFVLPFKGVLKCANVRHRAPTAVCAPFVSTSPSRAPAAGLSHSLFGVYAVHAGTKVHIPNPPPRLLFPNPPPRTAPPGFPPPRHATPPCCCFTIALM